MELKKLMEVATEGYDEGRALENEVDNKTLVLTDLCFYGSD